jgi:hypothetical protein
VAGRVDFAGSVKWLESPFDGHDLTALRHTTVQVPGFDPAHSGLAVVSHSGVADGVPTGDVDPIRSAADVVRARSS